MKMYIIINHDFMRISLKFYRFWSNYMFIKKILKFNYYEKENCISLLKNSKNDTHLSIFIIWLWILITEKILESNYHEKKKYASHFSKILNSKNLTVTSESKSSNCECELIWLNLNHSTNFLLRKIWLFEAICIIYMYLMLFKFQ